MITQNLSKYQELTMLIPQHYYIDVIMHILEVHYFQRENASFPLFTYFNSIIQICDENELSGYTKFLTRAYFDTFLAQQPPIDLDQIQTVGFCCLLIACKFNETPSILDDLDPQDFLEFSNSKMNLQEFYELEKKIIVDMKFKLKFSDPFDYVLPTLAQMPKLVGREQALCKVIDLALTMPQMFLVPGEKLFYGCFEMFRELKKVSRTCQPRLPLESMEDIIWIKNKVKHHWDEEIGKLD